jgi:rubredoxin
MTTDLFCWSCAGHGAVERVTAGLRCDCGSQDIDLFDPGDKAQQQRIFQVSAALAQPEPEFVDFMTKQAYTDPGPVGSEIPGWDVYKGPMPGVNPMANSDDPHMGPKRCPVCHGSGYDLQDKTKCRECGGTGFMTPTTDVDPPAVARHNYPSTQTKVPFIGSKQASNPLVLRGAACPNFRCRTQDTNLVVAANGNGWWNCPSCGPLADIDRHPEIDPYHPPTGFRPNKRSYKSASRTTRAGRLVSVATSVAQQNPGLTPREVVALARNTVRRYPEA